MSVFDGPLFRISSALLLCLLVGLAGMALVPDRASAAGILRAGTVENTSPNVA